METAMNKKHKKRKKVDFLPIMLLSPTIFIVLIVMIIPLLYGLFMSFTDYSMGLKISEINFVGAQNYINMFKDGTVWKSLKNTVLFALGATAGDLIIGTFFAVLLLRIRHRVSKFFRSVLTMPLLISPIIVGLIWRYMYDPYSGIVYWILDFFGIGIEQFPGVTSQSTALLSVIIAHWWQVTPFVLIVVTAGLVSIPRSLYEAAEIDGAGEIRQFSHISLPLLKRVYMVILVISGVDTIKVFDIIYSLTQGGPSNSTVSISIYAFRNAFEMSKMGYAMAISILALVVTFIVFGIPFIKFNSISEDR